MELTLLIRRYLSETGTTETRFGREAAGDPRLISDLRNGRIMGTVLEDRIRRFIADRLEAQ